jgi:hypothetical protein
MEASQIKSKIHERPIMDFLSVMIQVSFFRQSIQGCQHFLSVISGMRMFCRQGALQSEKNIFFLYFFNRL